MRRLGAFLDGLMVGLVAGGIAASGTIRLRQSGLGAIAVTPSGCCPSSQSLLHCCALIYLRSGLLGATPGKRLVGMRVVDTSVISRAGFSRMLLQELIDEWVSALVPYLGFLRALSDKERQT